MLSGKWQVSRGGSLNVGFRSFYKRNDAWRGLRTALKGCSLGFARGATTYRLQDSRLSAPLVLRTCLQDSEGGAAALMYVLLATVIAALVLMFLFLNSGKLTGIGDRQHQIIAIAEQGVAVYGAAEQVTAGTDSTYTPSQLIPDANDVLPWGNGWVAQTQSGGTNGNNVVSVFFNGAPQSASGITGITDSTLQTTLAWDVAGVMYQRLKSVPNTLVGVVQSGQTDLQVISETASTVSVAETVQVNSNPAPFSTPMILGNYAGTAQTGPGA